MDTLDTGWATRLASIARQAGQDPARIADLVAPVLVIGEHRLDDTTVQQDAYVGPAVRWAVLHGFTPEQTADLFDLPYDKVEQFYNSVHCPTSLARQVVALAKGGLSITEMKAQLGVKGKGWLYRTLDHARVDTNPHGAKSASSPEQRTKAIRMYRKGWKYRDIAERTGLGMDNIKNVLRAAAQRGDLPEYGNRRSTPIPTHKENSYDHTQGE